MSSFKAALQPEKNRHGMRKIDQFFLDMEEGDKADVLDALNDPTISNCAIARALTKIGLTISERAVRTYRESL